MRSVALTFVVIFAMALLHAQSRSVESDNASRAASTEPARSADMRFPRRGERGTLSSEAPLQLKEKPRSKREGPSLSPSHHPALANTRTHSLLPNAEGPPQPRSLDLTHSGALAAGRPLRGLHSIVGVRTSIQSSRHRGVNPPIVSGLVVPKRGAINGMEVRRKF
jgi:hypothetical protein